jgi:hypothetical protein
MTLALFSDLNFMKVYINLEKVCYSLAEIYIRSVYLNLFGLKGVVKFTKHIGGERKL